MRISSYLLIIVFILPFTESNCQIDSLYNADSLNQIESQFKMELFSKADTLSLVDILSQIDSLLQFDARSRKTLSIIAVGDIMMGSDYPRDYLPPNDGKNILSSVYKTLQDADITFGNLEGVLMDGGEPYKKCRDTTICYLFRTPTLYAEYLKKAGFDLISLANNHALDFGEIGRTTTMKTLDRAGILYSGRKGSIALWEVDSIKCGMIAFSTGEESYSVLDIEKAQKEVRSLSKKCDIVIVSFHGGAEGNSALHVRDTMETAYGEDRGNVYKFSHSVIDAGADLVLGHGPHVPRAMEIYKKRLIAYSLGNFCTYERFNLDGPKGIGPVLKVEVNGNGFFMGGEIKSTYQVEKRGPRLDPYNRAFKLVKELTESDFPSTGVKFDKTGNRITK